jgi:hydroxymethylpyrimidine pyrophosphatase-like HAD family hydrolase
VPDIQKKGRQARAYAAGGHIYKYVLKASSAKQAQSILQELQELPNRDAYNLHRNGLFLSITDRKATKQSGLETICRAAHLNAQHVAAIGNTARDASMLSAAGYPCAVLQAEDALKQMGGFILNPAHLPLFFESKDPFNTL